MQLRPSVHVVPPLHGPSPAVVAPHWVGLVDGLWQEEPSKHWPVGHWHMPPLQTRPPVHAVPGQPPQNRASVIVLMHSPMHSSGVADGHTQAPPVHV